ncbi:LPXTG cell wall anchor domain-containing protein [Fictibacillus phosphorivorans]|uniref:LPXTG cell wall anchor domain-containing protein n=1 Tax=Fictibacillus phosphorivorans TaxID=1221500 RepID=UPI00203F3CA3|nr:LPXTG cell wall anchor domain-containing protein [Fictibacillus phosphorivorans]MCM3717672.1 LPXTG cell wall anchor domain-containing protein [Fictibacillus phosphorivorans]MCM3775572.1 LPXTG cell wall anchor domain-containing protein [Fictibacillus phosphorivorans]
MKLNSIKFKLILIYSCLILIVAVFIPIGNTGADSSTPEIKIDTFPDSVLFDIKDFKPGDWAPRELTIQNNGNKDFSYNIQSRMKTGSEKLFNQFQLKIEDASGRVYQGSLKDFKGINPRPLASFSEEKLIVTVEFPYISGNEFQGLETKVEFVVYAEGKDEPPTTGIDNPDEREVTSPPSNDNENLPSKETGSLPQTGEDNPIYVILSGLFITLAGLALLLMKKSILPNPFKRV